MNFRLLIDGVLGVENELTAIDWGEGGVDCERSANRYKFLAHARLQSRPPFRSNNLGWRMGRY